MQESIAEYELALRYCFEENICFACWQLDPSQPVALNPNTDQCPMCDEDEWGEYQSASPIETASVNTQEDHVGEALPVEPLQCWGCREGVLNQLGHMDPGGCLYFEDDGELQGAA
ncbi:MAG: hypothetical protein EBR81_13300 [Proteobacteria bacterium]|nr:hypothetical protein [Pseudomonadota bacterium]